MARHSSPARRSGRGIFRAPWPTYRRPRPAAPPSRGPLYANADPADVVVEATAPAVTHRATAATPDVAVEATPASAAHRAPAPPVDVVVEVLPVTAFLRNTRPAVLPVDVVVEVLPVTVTKRVSTAPVDVVTEPATGSVTHRASPGPVDVVAAAVPVAVARRASTGPVDVVIDVLPVTVTKRAPTEIVDVAVEARRAVVAIKTPGTDIVVEATNAAVAYGGDGAERRGLTVAPVRGGVRVLAQAILSGRWLHWDLPLDELEVTWSLAGPTVIAGRLRPEQLDLRDVGLEPWGTWLHVEEDGLIRASGIMQPVQIDGETISIEALGPTEYARRIPYRATYSQVGVDPADVVRHLWAHIQSQPRGNLGLTVVGSTPVRLGTTPREKVDFTTGTGEAVSFDRGGPYELAWYENTLCGAEIDTLAKETPFDVVEQAAWNADRTDVTHRIELRHPQGGTRRTDLRFADGENILESAPLEEPAGAYADSVIVQGKGEGETAITATASVEVAGRLRMPVVYTDKTIGSTTRARALAGDELAVRLASLVEVPEIVVAAGHPNAPLGSFAAGDEIPIRLMLPWVGQFVAWHTIETVRWVTSRDAAVLGLSRRREFADR